LKQELSTQIGHGAVLLAVGTSGVNNISWFDWISANASGISVIIGICSFIAAVTFYTISYLKQSQASKNEIDISKINVKLESTDKHITEILELLTSKGKSNEKATTKKQRL